MTSPGAGEIIRSYVSRARLSFKSSDYNSMDRILPTELLSLSRQLAVLNLTSIDMDLSPVRSPGTSRIPLGAQGGGGGALEHPQTR